MPQHTYYANIRNNSKELFSAKTLSSCKRADIAIKAIAKTSITDLAKVNNTSRKFIYKQKEAALEAIKDAFKPVKEDKSILFYLPVTKNTIKQMTVSLTLDCHSSYEGIKHFFNNILDYEISKGSIHNTIKEVAEKAYEINKIQSLENIKTGAHDEIFQKNKPILVGCDINSTYCYLLKPENSRDGDTWGINLLDLEKQGLKPESIVADGGKGLRKGQKEVWKDISCKADIFHILRDMGRLETFLENKALALIKSVDLMQNRMQKAKKKGEGMKLSKKFGMLKKASDKYIKLSDDISTLKKWLREDILSKTGPEYSEKLELMNFIIEELTKIEKENLKIQSFRKSLEFQKKELLLFSLDIDKKLYDLSQNVRVDIYLVREVFNAVNGETCDWKRIDALKTLLGYKFHNLEIAVKKIEKETVRASSIVENINGRIRQYLFLKKNLASNDFLTLLQFFLNCRCFTRSNVAERIGKSPLELLTGEEQQHWLERLGFQLFKRDKKNSQKLAA